MSDSLQDIIKFWYDCIKSEQALDQSFGITKNLELTARTKAMLLPGHADPFVFTQETSSIFAAGEPMKALVKRLETRGEELYYGYPIMAFRDAKTQKYRVAPLFVIQLDHSDGTIQTTEPTPTLGAKATDLLGLKSEEASALNAELTKIFQDKQPTMQQDIFTILEKEVSLHLAEPIDSNSLDIRRTFNGLLDNHLYNRAILYTAETAAYNLHLLNDLDNLRKKHDITGTALDYLNRENYEQKSTATPIMPFLYDPYQLEGIQTILGSKSTVITGPPGTGKSQFIANLIVNLFMQRKKVLFVSHTNEAVRVVNERIGGHFRHMIMQTGRKEVRAELSHRLDEMTREYNEQSTTESVRLVDIERTWNDMRHYSAELRQLSEMNRQAAELVRDRDHYILHPGIMNRLRSLLTVWKLRKLMKISQKKDPSRDIQAKLHRLQSQHVKESREYVAARYLSEIVRSRSYGKLVAYVKSVEQRKSLSRYQQYNPGEAYMDDALGAMNIWSCTLKSLGANFPLKPGIFDYVIFDEASQIDLPSAAPALYRAKNLVIVGDKNQLTHIAKINEGLEMELAEKHSISDLATVSYRSTSLFASAQYKLKDTERTLLGHYRSGPLIAQIFNRVFYGSKLRIYTTNDNTLPTDVKAGAFWIDTKGEARKHPAGSRENTEEIEKIIRLYEAIRSKVSPDLTIGITSPYSRQTRRIAGEIERRYGADKLVNTKILTVHKFQGSEVDILLFSTVVASRGDGGSTVWYKQNPQIINVAISRAKHLLLIVGDEEYALSTKTSLADIAQAIRTPLEITDAPAGHASNYFETKLVSELRRYAPASVEIHPQHLVDGRYTVDIALIMQDKRIAIEVDGSQHELVGELALFDDTQRDSYLKKNNWDVRRISVAEIVNDVNSVAEAILASCYTKG